MPPGLSSEALEWTQPRSTLAAGTFYLDALRLLYCTSTLNRHFQHALIKAGRNLALVRAGRQAKGAAERSVAALPYEVAATLVEAAAVQLAHTLEPIPRPPSGCSLGGLRPVRAGLYD